ncbi:MAG: DUF3194 domain-containing protein [Asgard group archaeon]|nr:DUF3194 domain-containing protein [Asgard group archaeon]
MPLNEEYLNNKMKIGLRELTEDDIQKISEEVFTLVRKNLLKRVSSTKVDNYDIVIDIDNSQEQLRIDIDIISQLLKRKEKVEQEIIEKTLEETFNDLDKLLKEKYSC